MSINPERAKASDFQRNRRGNVTVLFALSLPIILLGIGLAVDFGRAASVRTQLNSAADAAALSALTPAMLQSTTSVAQAAAAAMFNASIANIGGLVAGGTNVSVTITSPANNPVMRIVTVVYSAQTQNFFAAIEPSATFQVAGSASAQASVPPNIDFYLLLDNSPSMSLPATSAGVTQMQNLTPDQGSCALACHQASTNNGDTADNPCALTVDGVTTYSTPTLSSPPPSRSSGSRYCATSQGTQIDNFALARLNNITLRLDELTSGVSTLMNAASTMASSGQFSTPPSYRFAAYSMDTLYSVPTTDNNPLMGLTDKYVSGWASASANFGVMEMYANSVGCVDASCATGVGFNDVATNYDTALSSINNKMQTPGNGTNIPGDKPQEVLFFVTDGVEDEQNIIRLIQPINGGSSHNYCTDIKARGIKIAILYTEYLPLPANSFYNGNVAPFQSQIGPALEACASYGLFYDASVDTNLGDALTHLLQSVVQSATLTN